MYIEKPKRLIIWNGRSTWQFTWNCGWYGGGCDPTSPAFDFSTWWICSTNEAFSPSAQTMLLIAKLCNFFGQYETEGTITYFLFFYASLLILMCFISEQSQPDELMVGVSFLSQAVNACTGRSRITPACDTFACWLGLQAHGWWLRIVVLLYAVWTAAGKMNMLYGWHTWW